MPRFKLILEYDGTPFVGWQRQTNGLAVQQVVEEALGAIDGGPVTIRGAGRTDAGVHATGQVAHVDLAKEWDPYHLREAVNARMRPAPCRRGAGLPCRRQTSTHATRRRSGTISTSSATGAPRSRSTPSAPG